MQTLFNSVARGIVLASCMLLVACAQQGTAVSPLIIGESLVFDSVVLGEQRRLNVYLPEGYDRSDDKTYPVIYVLDGSMDEDFIHVAGVAQFGAFSWVRMLPESIVVGIANVDRQRDFTSPSDDPVDRQEVPTSGGSARFIESLRSEMQPLIKRSYRTRAPRTIVGQSLGGLLATEILLEHNALFDNYVIVSPSLWWNKGAQLEAEFVEPASSLNVFVGVGKEGEVMETVAKQLYEKLAAIKSENLQVSYEFFPELDHGDTFHLAVYAAFEKVFSVEGE